MNQIKVLLSYSSLKICFFLLSFFTCYSCYHIFFCVASNAPQFHVNFHTLLVVTNVMLLFNVTHFYNFKHNHLHHFQFLLQKCYFSLFFTFQLWMQRLDFEFPIVSFQVIAHSKLYLSLTMVQLILHADLGCFNFVKKIYFSILRGLEFAS